MAKTFTTGLVITGDSSGGVRAFKSVTDAAGRYDKAMRTTTATAERFEHQAGENDLALQTLANTARVAAGALAGVFAVGSLQGQAQMVAETDALSRALQMNTTTMLEWQYAAGQVGIDAGKMADIFKDTSDKIGDYLANAGGEAADMIESLKLNMQELRTLSPDQQLLAIVDAMERLPDPSVKVNFLESLADDAVRLLPLLENGGELLKHYTAEAQALGVALNEVEIANLVEADRAMKTLSATAQGLSNQLIVELAPGLSEGVATLREWITEAGGAAEVADTLGTAATGVAAIYAARLTGSIAAKTAATAKSMLADNQAAAAARELAQEESQVAVQTARRIAGEQTAAVTAARIAQQRAQQAQAEAAEKLRSIQLAQQQLAAERALETQRLQAQISATGRQQSLTRLAEIRQQEVRMSGQLTTAVQSLSAAKNATTSATRALTLAEKEQARTSVVAEAAMAKTATTTRAAGAAQVVMTGTARALSGAMALLGGPAGVALLAGSALMMFATRADEAKQSATELAGSIELASDKLREMTDNQLLASRLKIEDALVSLDEQLGKTAARKEWLDQQLQRTPGSGKVGEWTRDLTELAAQIDTDSAKAEELRAKLEEINGYLSGDRPKGNKGDDDETTPKTPPGKDRTASMRSTAQEYIQELQRLNASEQQMVEHWRTDSLSRTESFYKQGLIDAEQYEFGKVAIAEEAARRLQQLEDKRWSKYTSGGLGDLAQEQRDAQSIGGPRGELIRSGVQQAIEDQTFQGLPTMGGSLAPEFSTGFGEANRLEEEKQKMLDAYDQKIADYQNYRQMEVENAALYDQELAKLRDQRQAEELAADQQIQQAKLAGAEAAFGNMASIAKTFAGEQSGLYRTMFAMEKGYALAKVMMNAPKTASDAYQAMAGIPVVGPALGVAAAAAALTYQATQAAGIQSISLSGQAHDGIDYVPNEGTWNLAKGERVTGAALNRDLTQFLERENKQGGRGGGGAPISVSVEVVNQGRPAQAKTRVEQLSEREFVVQVMMEEATSGLGGSPFNVFADQHGLQRVGR